MISTRRTRLRWPVALSHRGLPGARQSVAEHLGEYLFLPPGFQPPPGWNNRGVSEVVRAAAFFRPSLRAVDFAADLRRVGNSSPRTPLFAGMLEMVRLLSRIGARYRAEKSTGWRPCQSIPWWGFANYANDMTVGLEVLSGPRIWTSVRSSRWPSPAPLVPPARCVGRLAP